MTIVVFRNEAGMPIICHDLRCDHLPWNVLNRLQSFLRYDDR